MQLAETPFIALLNHDDLWLPDHLERGIRVLQRGDVDFYAGSAAFAHETRNLSDTGWRPVFSERTPKKRQLSDCYWATPFAFEPVSSWVVTKSLARRVGPWARGSDIFRLPLQDWVLRAWRHGASFHHDDSITTLKVNTHHGHQGSSEYERDAQDQLTLLHLIERLGSEGMARLVEDDMRQTDDRGLPAARNPWLAFGSGPDGIALTERLRSPASVQRFLDTGHDTWDDICQERELPRGEVLSAALKRRTGEIVTSTATLDHLVEHAREQLREP